MTGAALDSLRRDLFRNGLSETLDWPEIFQIIRVIEIGRIVFGELGKQLGTVRLMEPFVPHPFRYDEAGSTESQHLVPTGILVAP